MDRRVANCAQIIPGTTDHSHFGNRLANCRIPVLRSVCNSCKVLITSIVIPTFDRLMHESRVRNASNSTFYSRQVQILISCPGHPQIRVNQVLDLDDNSLVPLSLPFAAGGILFAFLYLEHVQSFLSQNIMLYHQHPLCQ